MPPVVSCAVFLPILTVARELDSRLMLAASLCHSGHIVYLGLTRTLTAIARESPPSIYVTPLINSGPEKRLREMKALGHWIAGWDEEGLVYPSGPWYRTDRVGAGTLSALDLLITWGVRQRADIAPLLGEVRPRVAVYGNPRADMLGSRYRRFADAEAAAIRERYGRFVLINTNFDLANHPDGTVQFQRRLLHKGYFADVAGRRRLKRWVAYRTAMFRNFAAGIPRLLDRLGDRTVILRPHPSEELAPWRELEARHDRLIVAPASSSVHPWLIAADYLIHNSCMTAVEAFALGTRAIAIAPPDADPVAESPLPNELSLRVPDWDAAAAAIERDDGAPTEAQREMLARYIARYPRQNSIAGITRSFAEVSPQLACARLPDPGFFARYNIGMVTTLKDENSRFPRFDSATIDRMRAVLATSPHGAPRLDRMHDYAVALSPAGSTHLLSSPANAVRLGEAIRQLDAGQGKVRDLIEP